MTYLFVESITAIQRPCKHFNLAFSLVAITKEPLDYEYEVIHDILYLAKKYKHGDSENSFNHIKQQESVLTH